MTSVNKKKRDFLTIWDLTAGELIAMLARAAALKAARAARQPTPTLAGQTLAMLFDKASTRTRVSFEVGMYELGGHAVYLSPQGSQVGRGESVADTARILGGYCHGIVFRTFGHDRVEELARFSPVPVINGLTDESHPCQILADLLTVRELLGDVREARYAWIGDGNNMAHAWIDAAALLGFDLALACPEGYDPSPAILARARAHMSASGKGSVEVVRSPARAAHRADVISTDVWASMGQEAQAAARRQAFAGYIVDETLLAQASARAIVLHCLPAHRDEEISAAVLDGPRAAVWRQAENRLHTQKALLELLLS